MPSHPIGYKFRNENQFDARHFDEQDWICYMNAVTWSFGNQQQPDGHEDGLAAFFQTHTGQKRADQVLPYIYNDGLQLDVNTDYVIQSHGRQQGEPHPLQVDQSPQGCECVGISLPYDAAYMLASLGDDYIKEKGLSYRIPF
jgi:hypothetical protein